jgi:glucosamine-6-phosphate isomerase
MKIKVYPSYEKLSQSAAEEMARTIELKPESVISVASGNSPMRSCRIFVDIVRERKIDVSKVFFVGLDEWLGVNPNDAGSGESFFKKNIAEPLGIGKNNYHMFDAAATNLPAACKKMDDVVSKLGGIDLMVVGIGINGHIGFNEPGVSFDLKSHVIGLTNTTMEVGQKYFSENKSLKNGITLGLAHLMEAHKVLLLADGRKKTAIVAKAFNGAVSREIPASILLQHANSVVMLDRDAAAELTVSFDRIDN